MTDENIIAKAGKNKGGRPRKDVTKTKEFQEAVSSAVEAAQADIVAKISAQLATAGGVQKGDAPAESNQITELTRSIMAMVNANKPEKPLSPEEVQSRADGQTRLIRLLLEVQGMDFDAPGAPDAPFYRVVTKTFLTDFVVEPFDVDPVSKAMVPRTIHWTGIPNESLEPINEWAQQVHSAYMQSIGGPTEFGGEADNRAVGVTPGGIVVKGLNASAWRNGEARPVGGLRQGSTTDVMGIRNQSDPRAKSINVLGTIASAAIAGDAPKFSGQLR